MSEEEENVQNESEEQFKIEDLDDIYKSQDSLEKQINKNNNENDSIEDNANYNYISYEKKEKEEEDNNNNQDYNIINNIEEINYNNIIEENTNPKYDKDNNTIINKEIEYPINLIEFNRNNFILNEKALNILNSINEDLIIISIVGKARTGKSYLMNLLLNYNNIQYPGKGFQFIIQIIIQV